MYDGEEGYGSEASRETGWEDGMDFEAVVQLGLEEEEDMNEVDVAFMRGYLGEMEG